jgi:hypothetical protein
MKTLNILVTNVKMDIFDIKVTSIYVIGMAILVPWNPWPLTLQLFF